MHSRQTLAVLAVFSLLGACDSHPAGPPAPATSAPAPDTQVIQLTADGATKFTPSTISVHPGKVRIVLATTGAVTHMFAAPALGVNSGEIAAGKTVTLDFNVPKAGDYPFWCAYHRGQGMTGTITAR